MPVPYFLGLVNQPHIVLTDGSYNVTPDELFDLFGKFGPIRYDWACTATWFSKPN